METRRLTREELREWLDRAPTHCACMYRPCACIAGLSWRDFEPETCTVVEAGNGWMAVRLETGDESGQDSNT